MFVFYFFFRVHRYWAFKVKWYWQIQRLSLLIVFSVYDTRCVLLPSHRAMQFRFRLWRNLDCMGRLYWSKQTDNSDAPPSSQCSRSDRYFWKSFLTSMLISMYIVNTQHHTSLNRNRIIWMISSTWMYLFFKFFSSPVVWCSFGCIAAPAHLWWACDAVLSPFLQEATHRQWPEVRTRVTQAAKNLPMVVSLFRQAISC